MFLLYYHEIDDEVTIPLGVFDSVQAAQDAADAQFAYPASSYSEDWYQDKRGIYDDHQNCIGFEPVDKWVRRITKYEYLNIEPITHNAIDKVNASIVGYSKQKVNDVQGA